MSRPLNADFAPRDLAATIISTPEGAEATVQVNRSEEPLLV
ncbi:hypothetical protein [Streptosporangium saharense]